jgi:hypothetical protein
MLVFMTGHILWFCSSLWGTLGPCSVHDGLEILVQSVSWQHSMGRCRSLQNIQL